MNVADSELVSGILRRAGYERTADPAAADVLLVNTCAIRENAEERVLGRLSDLLRHKMERPGFGSDSSDASRRTSATVCWTGRRTSTSSSDPTGIATCLSCCARTTSRSSSCASTAARPTPASRRTSRRVRARS